MAIRFCILIGNAITRSEKLSQDIENMSPRHLEMSKTISARSSLFWGACWYPEHQAETKWMDELNRMRESGLACVRVGDGSWSILEPSDGLFEFDWLDRVLDIARTSGMGVILCTPTYAVPGWMKKAHPEVMACRLDGRKWGTITRRTCDLANPIYRNYCNRVVRELASRYANHPSVWAWQVDNEVYCHWEELGGEFICQAFQKWLDNRYGTVQALNQAWGLGFWSCALDSFQQVELPRPVPTALNQHQKADYLRFLSDLAIAFLHEQAREIRKINPHAWVAHNHPFGAVDKEKLFSELDIFGVDHYPAFSRSLQDKLRCSLNYAEARFCAKRIWAMEQQATEASVINHRNPASAPGEIALLALQSIGAGANAVLWFNWRTFPFGPESIWRGLLPPWGDQSPALDEIKSLIQAIQPFACEIAKSTPCSDVIRLLNHDQSIFYRCEPWIEECLGTPWDDRAVLRCLGLNEIQKTPVRIAEQPTSLVALLPMGVSMNSEEINALETWVLSGGTLLVGPLAGMRDQNFHLPLRECPPGMLGRLTGTRITSDTILLECMTLRDFEGTIHPEAGNYAEILLPVESGVRVLATYDVGWMRGQAAITTRALGNGHVIHCGVRLARILQWLWPLANLPRPNGALTSIGPGVEILTRTKEEGFLHFVLNHGEEEGILELQQTMHDLVADASVSGTLFLQPRSWKILQEDGAQNAASDTDKIMG